MEVIRVELSFIKIQNLSKTKCLFLLEELFSGLTASLVDLLGEFLGAYINLFYQEPSFLFEWLLDWLVSSCWAYFISSALMAFVTFGKNVIYYYCLEVIIEFSINGYYRVQYEGLTVQY